MSIDLSKIKVKWTKDEKEFMEKDSEFLNSLTCCEDFKKGYKMNLPVSLWSIKEAPILLALEIRWNDTQNLYLSFKNFRKIRGKSGYKADYFLRVRHGDSEYELDFGEIEGDLWGY